MNVLKPVLGLLLLLLGVLILTGVVAQLITFCTDETIKTEQNTGIAYNIGFNIGRFGTLAIFVVLGYYMVRTGRLWLVFRSKPNPMLGRDDILDDGDLHKKSNS